MVKRINQEWREARKRMLEAIQIVGEIQLTVDAAHTPPDVREQAVKDLAEAQRQMSVSTETFKRVDKHNRFAVLTHQGKRMETTPMLQVSVSVTGEEKEKLRTTADRLGCSMSDVIRRLMYGQSTRKEK